MTSVLKPLAGISGKGDKLNLFQEGVTEGDEKHTRVYGFLSLRGICCTLSLVFFLVGALLGGAATQT